MAVQPADPKPKTMDCKRIAREVYDLASSADPLAPLVKEALDVIDSGLDSHGWGLVKSVTWITSECHSDQGRSAYRLASMGAKTVSINTAYIEYCLTSRRLN